MAQLRKEELDVLVRKLTELRAQDIVNSHMIRISSVTAKLSVSELSRCSPALPALLRVKRKRADRIGQARTGQAGGLFYVR